MKLIDITKEQDFKILHLSVLTIQTNSVNNPMENSADESKTTSVDKAKTEKAAKSERSLQLIKIVPTSGVSGKKTSRSRDKLSADSDYSDSEYNDADIDIDDIDIDGDSDRRERYEKADQLSARKGAYRKGVNLRVPCRATKLWKCSKMKIMT